MSLIYWIFSHAYTNSSSAFQPIFTKQKRFKHNSKMNQSVKCKLLRPLKCLIAKFTHNQGFSNSEISYYLQNCIISPFWHVRNHMWHIHLYKTCVCTISNIKPRIDLQQARKEFHFFSLIEFLFMFKQPKNAAARDSVESRV